MRTQVSNIPLFASLLAIAAIFHACEHEPFPIIDDGGITINPPDTVIFSEDPCSPDSVYFSNQIQPLIISSCAQPGCHDALTAEDGVVLNGYSNIINTGDVIPGDPNESEIYENITETDPDKIMPPPGEDPLTPEQIQLIYDWILQGAQNNGCSACDTAMVTFSGSILPFVELKCQGCHSGADPSAGFSLIDYDDVSNLVPGDIFIDVVTGMNGYTLMPLNNPIPSCQVDMIQAWLDDGAPDN